ncbi:LegC family aminotransferase [Tropicibacter naphthalenivorans]|uniref:Putative pyridoxal phosphate-dependent aminotransferase EpsN n=1 Tax=Tropicibacter naphthalenivorans TaxID=441103 RepID=A0A0P1H224_9RHOB|nr:LegC family aminotransferase [Tropicibacter naphthalenivorans]CUH82387.1 Putative pyridoxal phosphate-dependent aminotransferase EpsN [Tropicibacter naphthalenivorans]SMD05495.1 perosamine synthetase [Tropicibacter naphthalenivorans]
MELAQDLVQRIRGVIGAEAGFVPLHVPEFHGRERELLIDCIDTGWVSSVGSYVDAFEAEVARLSGCTHGVVVANGTAALQIAMLVAGVAPGDEVLMPALTFVATANATSHLGAVPHFVDSAYDTMGVCPTRLRAHLEQVAEVREGATWNRQTGRRIAAIVPMHVFGCPVDMDGLDAVVADWPMVVVEDAAESLGSTYHGRPCGSLGRIAAISFNGNKIVTTGGGGAIVTNDEALAKRAKHLTTTAKQPHPWAFIHDEVGYNYRMPNLNAALGVAQLEQLGDRLAQKQRLFDAYAAAFDGLSGAQLFTAPEGSVSNNWLVTLILDPDMAAQRDTLLKVLNDAGIMTRPIWTLMHRLPMYQDAPRADLTQAADLEARVLNIPSSAHLGAAL